MHVLLDHALALLVGAFVLLLLVAVHLQGRQASTELALNYLVKSEALHVGQLLQRDLENMRTRAQTEAARAAGRLEGGTGYACSLDTTAGQTSRFQFPTLTNPHLAASRANPEEAAVTLVTYALRPMGGTVPAVVGGVLQARALHRLERLVDGRTTGGSRDYVTDFHVELRHRDTSAPVLSTSSCAETLRHVRVQLVVATQPVAPAAPGRRATSNVHLSRYGLTISPPNLRP